MRNYLAASPLPTMPQLNLIENPHPNKLIVVEGIDGTGKTSLAKNLEKAINRRNGELEKVTQGSANKIRSVLGNWLMMPDVDELLKGRRHGGAIYLDALNIENPTKEMRKERLSEAISPEVSLSAYLVSAAIKQKIAQALLPEFSVICDRYIFDVVARHGALGANFEAINWQHFPFLKPNLHVMLTTDEAVRQKRMSVRIKKDRMDRMPKSAGSFMDQMEKMIMSFEPWVLKTCELDEEQVVAAVREKAGI